MDGILSRESQLLCAYIAGQDGMRKLRMPFEDKDLVRMMEQEKLPELIVFLDWRVNPILVMKEGLIQFCIDDALGRRLHELLEKRKKVREGDAVGGNSS